MVLGAQLVTQLTILIKTARLHERSNAALQQSVDGLMTLLKTLGEEQRVVLRLQNDFLFLGESHLKMTAQQVGIFMELIDYLDGWRIGVISFAPMLGREELIEFA